MILHTLQWPRQHDPKKPTLVFLHGMGGTAQLWRPIAATLENDFNCVAFDQRGHGKSQLPTGATPDFTPLAYGSDIVESIQALGLKDVFLVGHSMGVRTGIATAYQSPDRVSALVLVDLGLSGPAGGGMGQPLRDFLVPLPTEFATRADLRSYVMTNCPDASIAQYLIAVSTPMPHGYGFPFDRASLIATIDAARDTSVRAWAESLAKIGKPMLFLRGEESKVWSAKQMEQEKESFRAYPNIHWQTLSGCGHGLPFEKRIEFCEILRKCVELNHHSAHHST